MNWTTATVAPANLLDWRERNTSFTDIAFYVGRDGKGAHVSVATLTGGVEPERVRAMDVSGNFFEVLGVEPAIGRVLGPSDTRQGELRAVVLSHAFWRRRFGANPSVIGTRVDIDGISTEIAASWGARFMFPAPTSISGKPADCP